jgi:hypothetical protein
MCLLQRADRFKGRIRIWQYWIRILWDTRKTDHSMRSQTAKFQRFFRGDYWSIISGEGSKCKIIPIVRGCWNFSSKMNTRFSQTQGIYESTFAHLRPTYRRSTWKEGWSLYNVESDPETALWNSRKTWMPATGGLIVMALMQYAFPTQDVNQWMMMSLKQENMWAGLHAAEMGCG